MKTVKCFIYRDGHEDCEAIIFVEDGGAASTSLSWDIDSDYLKTELHQERLTKKSKFESFWDDLSEGEIYIQDYDGQKDHKLKTLVDDEVIDDAINWLYASTRKVKFEKLELGVFTKKKFLAMKKEFIFD